MAALSSVRADFSSRPFKWKILLRTESVFTTATNSGGFSEAHIAVMMPDHREGCMPLENSHWRSAGRAAPLGFVWEEKGTNGT